MGKIKNIQFRCKVKGEGLVNYDTNDQKNILQSLKFDHLLVKEDKVGGGYVLANNVSYGKKRFYSDSDGKNTYKSIISCDAMRKAIFGDSMNFYTSLLSINDDLMISYIGHPSTFLRGYLQTMGKNEISYNKKSVIYTSDAVQTNDTITNVEVGTRAGTRDATSLRYREVAGDMEYSFHGAINLQEMQFTSLSEIFSRQAFNPDWFERYCDSMKVNLSNFTAKMGHFILTNAASKISERGFSIDNETIVSLVKYFFSKLLKASIKATKAYADVVEVQYKLIQNPLVDLVSEESGWVTLTLDNIDNISFEIEELYSETTDPLLIDFETEIINASTDKKEAKKEVKKIAAEERKKWKEAKDEKEKLND